MQTPNINISSPINTIPVLIHKSPFQRKIQTHHADEENTQNYPTTPHQPKTSFIIHFHHNFCKRRSKSTTSVQHTRSQRYFAYRCIFTLGQYTVLCKSNANEIRRNSFFVHCEFSGKFVNISERKCSVFFSRMKREGDVFSLMVTKIQAYDYSN